MQPAYATFKLQLSMRNFHISFSCFCIHFNLKVKHALLLSLSLLLPVCIRPFLSVSFTLLLCVLQLDFVFVVNKFIKRIPFAPFVLHKMHNERESANAREGEREKARGVQVLVGGVNFQAADHMKLICQSGITARRQATPTVCDCKIP